MVDATTRYNDRQIEQIKEEDTQYRSVVDQLEVVKLDIDVRKANNEKSPLDAHFYHSELIDLEDRKKHLMKHYRLIIHLIN